MAHQPVQIRERAERNIHGQKPMRMCGFCTWPSNGATHNLHDALSGANHCPIATLNGDGVTLFPCDCPCAQGLIKCLDCGTRERFDDPTHLGTKEYVEAMTERAQSDATVDPVTWRCYDPAECEARIEARLAADPVIQMIRSFQTEEKKQQYRQERRSASSRPTSGVCLHCEEPTKGGMFLPGHDAAFLSSAVKSITDGNTTLPEVLELWAGLGISEALRAKLEKRAA